jgi:hypothetical protein
VAAAGGVALLLLPPHAVNVAVQAANDQAMTAF